MKKLLSLIALTLSLAHFGAAPDDETPALSRIESLAWIAGSWQGESSGGVIEEQWMAPSGGTMSGMSRLVVGDRTMFHEYLRIVVNREGEIGYLAQPVGRCPPTAFRLTSVTDDEAVFENPEHDFPQTIRYLLEDDGATLVTIVEGTEKGVFKAIKSRMSRVKPAS